MFRAFLAFLASLMLYAMSAFSWAIICVLIAGFNWPLALFASLAGAVLLIWPVYKIYLRMAGYRGRRA